MKKGTKSPSHNLVDFEFMISLGVNITERVIDVIVHKINLQRDGLGLVGGGFRVHSGGRRKEEEERMMFLFE